VNRAFSAYFLSLFLQTLGALPQASDGAALLALEL
jgi:hypothetical protein